MILPQIRVSRSAHEKVLTSSDFRIYKIREHMSEVLE